MIDIANSKCLISHHWSRASHRSQIFSRDEKYIACSGEESTNIISLARGTQYDVSELIEKIDGSWYPDIFIAKVDAYFNLVPRNLQALDCIKILILGDTQHGRQPLTKMLAYAQEEAYDFYITDHKRHHLWFYHLAGIKNLYWLPGLFLRLSESSSPETFLDSKTDFNRKSVFIGQTGKFHPRRQRLLDRVKQDFPDFWVGQLSQQQTLNAYKYADISLNISLNGDLNLRNFEIVGSSGFLLSDRLSCESGLDLLLEKGREFDVYDDSNELCEKLAFYQAQPNLIKQIKANSYSKYQKVFSTEILLAQLTRIINGQSVDPLFAADTVFRIQSCRNVNYSLSRIALYEVIQELNLYLESVNLCFSGGCDFVSIFDFLDLPRTSIQLHQFSDEQQPDFGDLIGKSGEKNRFEDIDSLTDLASSSILFTELLSPDLLISAVQKSLYIATADFQGLEDIAAKYPKYFSDMRIFIFGMEFYFLCHKDDLISSIIEKANTVDEVFLESPQSLQQMEPSPIDKVYADYQRGDRKAAAAQIKKLVDSGVDIRRYGVNFAQILLLAADWNYISALLPRNTNFFQTSGWLNSVQSGRPINQNNQAIPWYTYPAIDFLDNIIQKDWTVFEWGSGNSTLWWSKRVQKVVSMESNKEWFEEINAQIISNVEFFYRDNDEYITYIEQYPDQSFDVIVVDGIKRNQCIDSAIPKLKDNGILVFDNSDREEYNSSQQLLMDEGFYRLDFWGLIPSYAYKNCTSIFSKGTNFLRPNSLPAALNSSVGQSCQQALDAVS